jgi:microcompartment protein CcmL/EutN
MPVPEALSLIEFSSIAVGTRAVDALVKKAPVALERVGTLQPGKLAVLFSGDLACVQASHAEALRVGGAVMIDDVLLPYVEPSVYRAIAGERQAFDGDTLGVIETSTMAATVAAADAAVKGAAVRVLEIRLGDELGGKGLSHFAGEQHDVEAALEIALGKAGGRGRLVQSSVTPRFDDELRASLLASTRFWGGDR